MVIAVEDLRKSGGDVRFVTGRSRLALKDSTRLVCAFEQEAASIFDKGAWNEVKDAINSQFQKRCRVVRKRIAIF